MEKKKKLDNNIFKKKRQFYNPRHNFNKFYPILNKIKQQQNYNSIIIIIK